MSSSTFVAFLFTLASGAAHAGWVVVATNASDGTRFYIDEQTIKVNGGAADVREDYNFV